MSHTHTHGTQRGVRRHAGWIAIVAIVAMLGAMLIYVFSNDEMLQPGEPVQNPQPAAAP